jgi:hypothetical protein
MHCRVLLLRVEIATFTCSCARVKVGDLDAFNKENAKAVPSPRLPKQGDGDTNLSILTTRCGTR